VAKPVRTTELYLLPMAVTLLLLGQELVYWLLVVVVPLVILVTQAVQEQAL
jgi:hypothetical protein